VDKRVYSNYKKTDYELFSPTDFRYNVPELVPYLSEEAYVRYKAKVEGALALQLANEGVCSSSVGEEINRATKKITVAEVYEEEARIRHDIRALVNVIRSKVSDKAKPFVHLAATSYDIVDTANALRFKEAIEKVVIPDLKKLEKILIELSRIYADTAQIGRTHGQHAEPVTFGYYLSFYVSRVGKRILAMSEASNNLAGKFAGAVGVYGPLSLLVKDPSRFEKALLDSLGLGVSQVSTQIIQPEPITDLIHYVISTFSVIANFSRDMRNLQRSEISEISEEFLSEQVGSSTMPQKRNPINFENVESMWKKFMPQMITVYMDQISEHQRDLTNSSSQRYLPELLVAFDYSVRRLTRTIWNEKEGRPKIVIDRQSMKQNLARSKEQIAAEPLYILLSASGHPDAHEKVREAVQRSITGQTSFLEAMKKDPDLKRYFDLIPKQKRKYIDNPELYTGIAAKKTLEIAKHWEIKLSLV
jgi:adenylosuccinate lyase